MESTDLLQSAAIIRTALLNLWSEVAGFLPQLLFAALVLIVGIALAQILKTAVIRIVRFMKIDDLLKRFEVTALFEKAHVSIDVAEIFGFLTKWFVVVLALIATADVLNWDQITVFLTNVVNYIPNVLIAVVILLVGFLLGGFVQSVIRGAFEAAQMKTAGILGSLAKWAIIVFCFMAALVQLGIAESLINTLFIGFTAMLALAGGLAFGLGGRDHARRVLDAIDDDIRSKRRSE